MVADAEKYKEEDDIKIKIITSRNNRPLRFLCPYARLVYGLIGLLTTCGLIGSLNGMG